MCQKISVSKFLVHSLGDDTLSPKQQSINCHGMGIDGVSRLRQRTDKKKPQHLFFLQERDDNVGTKKSLHVFGDGLMIT